MAAYGVIGGIIGGAIALAISPMLINRARKRYNKKEHKEPVSYYPGVTVFLFICSVCTFPFSILIGIVLFEEFSILYFLAFLLSFFSSIIIGCWSGSFLRARITISKERLIIEHAAKMSNKDQQEVKVMQLGRHHLDVSWEEIRELRANVNFMKIILCNDECYMFPIGWCREAARFAVEHHKPIKPWE